MGTSHTDIDKM